MSALIENSTILTTRVQVRPELMMAFADWQAMLNADITTFPGFISLEILLTQEENGYVWTIVQRFSSPAGISGWINSIQNKELVEVLKKVLSDETLSSVQEVESKASTVKGGVTEVFVTKVSAEKESAYREWIAKIHRIEAKFPGFRGMYVQAPTQGQAHHWMTFLHFDTPENLDNWLSSSERREVLVESESLIASLESHRVVSPYAGWFASVETTGEVALVWKQTMLVLLVLFPIVMLELKYLSPLTGGLNFSLGMFIGNVLSVSLIAWPLMPFVLRFLGWWLNPQGSHSRRATIFGAFLICCLYLLEIAVFWNFH